MHPLQQKIIKVYGHEPQTLDELAQAVIAVAQLNCRNTLVGFHWDIVYWDLVSNSHDSPIGQPQNWHRDPNLPPGYPGFLGRVWYRFSGPHGGFGSDALRNSLTYTGTGGAGGYDGPWERLCHQVYEHQKKYKTRIDVHCYSYDYRFFLSDWPLLENMVRQEQTLALLSDRVFHCEHRFGWDDPVQVERDRQVLDRIGIKETA
jgi:hypothetical protein